MRGNSRQRGRHSAKAPRLDSNPAAAVKTEPKWYAPYPGELPGHALNVALSTGPGTI